MIDPYKGKISNPYLPEGVTERDIDNSCDFSEEEDEDIHKTVERLKIENQNMKMILRLHQWNRFNDNKCTVCDELQSNGHHKDCFLAWVLMNSEE